MDYRSSMHGSSTGRWLRALSFVAALTSAAEAQGPPQLPSPERLIIGYVDVTGDPRYEPITGYGRLALKHREHPFAGTQVGLDETQALSRVSKTEFALERISVASPAEVAPAVVKAAATRNVHFFIVDAAAEAFKPLAAAVRGRDILVFNATEPDDTLRREICAAEFVHTLPSMAMYMDGLVQHFVSRKWGNLLVLEGPLPSDAVMVTALEKSARKFGARIVARQQFKPGTDPREREKNDPVLLSAMTRDYDVVVVADNAFDFAREVPYRTARPRPVAGSIGLEPVAWHWTWEHNGAPQVNSRFEKRADGRHMQSADWASWIAVKMVAQAALRSRSTDFKTMRSFLLREGSFDGNKGLAVSVRPWDHQLRQAVLLADQFAVAAQAPIEGFLHKTNNLDTLGDDAPESPCHLGE